MIGHEQLADGFQRQFGKDPACTYFSPGRVNLIGEHTDYNGGSVLPVAIDVGTYFAVRSNNSGKINIFSEAFSKQRSISLGNIGKLKACGQWHDYVAGTLIEYANLGISGKGLDIYVTGDLPRGSGLSSSASFTVGIARLLNDLWDGDLKNIAIVHMAKAVENNFIGLQCGIMDQFAVTFGQVNNCIHLQCTTMEWELVPLNMRGHEIVIIDSKVPRKLSQSAYNIRRTECLSALSKLNSQFEFNHLCEASIQDIKACDELSASPVELKRAYHVVSEDVRVTASVEALKSGEMERFGQLMIASHNSLRDDFEVSCPELDFLVDSALNIPGVLGSRMTGAGFGGCTVSLIATEAVPNFISQVCGAYAEKSPFQARAFRCHSSDGAKKLN